MIKLKQPIITNREVNRIERYQTDIRINGYRPYITVKSSNSVGMCNIIFSHKTQRSHHLLSLGELSLFLHLEHDKNVVEIYEQYPLPIHETLNCAEELDIWHPARYKEKDHATRLVPATTMTTDIVAVIKDDSSKGYKLQPYNYKPSESLSNKYESTHKVNRTKKKFEIECLYWQKQGYTLVQMTEQDLNPVRTYNLKWLRECYLYPNLLEVPEMLYSSLLLTLTNNLINKPKDTLRNQLQFVSTAHTVPLEQMMRLFQYACYNSDISVDLNTGIELYRPLTMLDEATNAH